MVDRSSPESPNQHLHTAVQRLIKYLRSQSYQWVKTVEELSQALLFPLLLWVTLCLLVLVFPRSGPWNLNLITTFVLPLLTLFIAYRAIAAIVLLTFGEEVYTSLIQRFLLPLFITYAVLQFLGLFEDISLLGDIQLFTVANTTITLRSLFIASIGLYLWFAGVTSLAQFLRRLLHDRLYVEEATIDASLILLRYFLIGLGLVVVFSELKLDSTAIAAISGGLAVGIGFGLKDIVINFISGIILLFERSLRPGDVIEFNSKMGRVEEINLRATTIKTRDHIEIVIPNQLFWNASLISYTRRSRITRFEIEVIVGYDHAPDTVTTILVDAVRKNSKLSTGLTAKVEIGGFKQDGVFYKLKFWTDDPFAINTLRDKIYRSLWKAFEAEGIELETLANIKIHSSEALTYLGSASSKPQTDQDQHLTASKPPQPLISPPKLAQSKASTQVELVENSFEKIKPHAAEFSASFYKNLFRSSPKLRSMFSTTDMEKQQQKLVSALVLLVSNVRAPDMLVPMLRDLGARHKGYGVIEEHYPAIGGTLLQTFEQYLKEDWTPEVKQAWTNTFDAIAQIMLEGAEESQ
ncbi:mechanosensitive ion channel [Nodosilinea sp. FACHB-131]|uniref:mechanosensitive ion channel domain-containing protein n=1 Tax=Cyanophyceae TaxID=3028117 RepID=UPI001687E2C2|nr:mechanosensitive ion channel domain-containing protein [Nodosilinea sp. FACHB-131]MBD1876115.1 mechanosensitive ion channel [Nodosilinea sp. FACHB-131]